jgi:endonuclease/exonuclease/phosphatase family metal-dependent hydrolase
VRRRPWRRLWRAVLTEIYLCNVCSCQEVLRRHGRGQARRLERQEREARELQQAEEERQAALQEAEKRRERRKQTTAM